MKCQQEKSEALQWDLKLFLSFLHCELGPEDNCTLTLMSPPACGKLVPWRSEKRVFYYIKLGLNSTAVLLLLLLSLLLLLLLLFI